MAERPIFTTTCRPTYASSAPGGETYVPRTAAARAGLSALYGFAAAADRDFFKILVEKVSGIGPKTALNMMSRMSVSTLRDAVSSGDVATLSKCPGIGKKTAERLVLELKGTLSGAAISPVSGSFDSTVSASPASDAVAALVALGVKIQDADKAVRASVAKLGESATTEQIVKLALSK